MEKKIEDYLHLYLGCKVQTNSSFDAKLSAGNLETAIRNEWRPILRTLSDIQSIEVAQLFDISGSVKRGNFLNPFFQIEYTDLDGVENFKHLYIYQLSPKHFLYLLSKHFDLFGLIEAGLCLR